MIRNDGILGMIIPVEYVIVYFDQVIKKQLFYFAILKWQGVSIIRAAYNITMYIILLMRVIFKNTRIKNTRIAPLKTFYRFCFIFLSTCEFVKELQFGLQLKLTA